MSSPMPTYPEPADIDLAAEDQQAQTHRAGSYGLLATLLRDAPTPALVGEISHWAQIPADADDELGLGMRMLGLSAQHTQPFHLQQEFHDLFIGIGRGELVPFGSWYLTGYLMEKPLVLLRSDLQRMGFERQADNKQPEDHIAALCDVMSLLIQEQTDHLIQADFFDRHIAPWAQQFFDDLSQAESATFYRSVGRFGGAFMHFEKQYLGMAV